MATMQQKREALKGAYPGEKWQSKVAKMPESQVTAVYLNLKAQGKV